MAGWIRWAYIENARPLTDSGVYVTDINIADPITALFLEFRATNGGTSNRNNTVAENIQRIEVIDGGDVVVSLDGREAAGLYWHLDRTMGGLVVSENASVEQVYAVPMLFGRWFGDPSFALDPSRFRNLQFRIQWDLASVNPVGATGFVSGSARLTLRAAIIEGKGKPQGVLEAKRWREFTTAASGVDITELPTNWPYKALMIRAHEHGTLISATVTNVKLQADGNKVVFFDEAYRDFLRSYIRQVGPYVYRHQFLAANAATLRVIPKFLETLSLHPTNTDSVAGYNNTGIGEGALSLITGGTADTTARLLHATVSGYAPYGCVVYEFGDPWNPDDWLTANAFGRIRLELTQGDAGGEARVVLQQARAY